MAMNLGLGQGGSGSVPCPMNKDSKSTCGSPYIVVCLLSLLVFIF